MMVYQEMNKRQQFEQKTQRPTACEIRTAVLAARRGEAEGQATIAAVLAWVAYSCPQATQSVYNLMASAWLDVEPNDAEPFDLPQSFTEAPLTDSFWSAYWSVIDGARAGYDATSITVAVASLGGAVDASFSDIAEACARSHPGGDRPHEKQVPGLTDILPLADCPPDSLGRALYDLLTVNGYDPEVLDRNAIMLSQLPPALQYHNTRILQMHDVWHLVAGYETTGIQEVAISSFQLAQFGHNYSSMFLAAVTCISHELNPRGFSVLMQIIAEAWQHGRQTPALMAIEWEEEWDTPLDDVRRKYGIEPFESVFPADLMEIFSQGSVWRKLQLGVSLFKFNRAIGKQTIARAA